MKHPTLTYLAWSLLNALFAFGAVLAASLLFGWRAMCAPTAFLIVFAANLLIFAFMVGSYRGEIP
jgi:hypothetical protein